MIQDNQESQATKPRNRWIKMSAMHLLAAGALCVAGPTSAAVVTDLNEFLAALNQPLDEDIILTGTDIDLLGQNVTITVRLTQFFGDGTPRTISNGTVIVTSPASDTNYNLLNLSTDIRFTGDIVLNDFARLDIDDPIFLGTGGTVTAGDDADIRLFSFDGATNTYDATFFAKILGEPDSTSFSIVGDGEGIFTALPIFDAQIILDEYTDFDFVDDPAQDPLLTLGATLAGNHDLILNFGTLDLNDFDFTVDSLTGATGTSILLGTGTLTAGDGQDTTFAGVISETGNFVKTGTGTLTFSATNTYSGSTTVSGGILVFEADQTGTSAIIVQNTGTLWVNADQTGTPTYTIQNGGTVVLNADVVDTTAVTVDTGGILNLNDFDQTLGSIAGGGMIDLGEALLTVGDATSTTFSGVITGDGGLTKVGAGNLTLSGANTYGGPTTLTEGILTVDGTLGSTSSVSLAAGTTLVLNGDINNNAPVSIALGATLDLNDNDETLAQITGTGGITLGTGTLTVGNNNSFTFGGVISETGGLTKQGNGTLTLSAAQTYTGPTLITDGTLVANGNLDTSGVTVNDGATFNLESTLTSGTADVTIDDGGTLFGNGTIGDDLINNGLVTFRGPGAGDTLTVNGDYTQGATGTLEIQLGNAGGLFVAGTANLGGTLDISVPADPANFDITATYNVVNAGGTSGNFATVTDNFAFLDLTSNNVGGNVEITLARNAVALNSIANTANQNTVATVLDGLGAPTGTLEDAIDRILASSEAGARSTYDDLAGAGAATTGSQLAANTLNQNHRLLDEVIGVAPGTSRPTGAFSQAPNSGSNEADHLTLLSFYQGEAGEESEEETDIFGDLDPTAWGSFYGGFGDVGDGAEGLDYIRYGLIIGLELESDETEATYGLSLGVEQSEFDFNQDNGDVDITSLYVSGYTRQPFGEDWHVTFAGGLGYHQHESTRNILIGVTPTPANADFDSFSVSLAAEISKSFQIIHTPVDPGGHPTDTSIEPFARLAYSLSAQDGYSETGAGPAGLNVGDIDYDSVRAQVGVRVQHQYMFYNQYEATLQGRALADIAISDTDSDLNVSFVGAPGTGFSIEGTDQDDIFGQIGVGLSVELDDDWDLHLGIDQQFSDDAFGTVIAGGLSYSF